MAKVVIFARNMICIELIDSLIAQGHKIVAVFSAKEAPEYAITKTQISDHCKKIIFLFIRYSITKLFPICLPKKIQILV